MGKVIGIDLGTTTCAMAYIEDGKPKIIIDDSGSRIIPSVVGVSEDGEENFIGEHAKNQLIVAPERTVSEAKRTMGTNNKYRLGDDELLSHEVAAILLKELKKYAEGYFNEEVTEAVITVPANFTGNQRELTKQAGELAGFKVERIINEPTAAAMAYGIDKLETEEKVLVYDLGGGTFDVTTLELFEGILEVKSSRGNNMLGGKDFDERIEKYIIEEFKKQHGIDLYLNNDLRVLTSIKDAAEKAKKELSSKSTTTIMVPFVAFANNNPLSINMQLSRSKFEELIEDLVQSTEDTINEALKAAGYTEEDIDVVLFVGGSTRVPRVRKLVEDKFPNKIKGGINPDEAVAMGAAVQAGIKSDEISSETGLIVTDISSLSLGTSVTTDVGNGRIVDGIFDCIIPRGTSLPCTQTQTYITVYNNQERVNVDVYEGDAILAAENTKLADLLLEGIPQAPAGEQEIAVTFSYDLNGILEVTSKIVSTGKELTQKIDTNVIKNSSDSIIDKYFNERNKLNNWRNCKLASMVINTVELAEKKMEKMSEDQKIKVEAILNKLKEAVISDDTDLVEKYDEELTDLLFDII